ncbi:nucleotidyl cyclase domain-containing protein [Shewanella sedimentimangrovi]|uniref:GGDEF domain-containing protein n=1 Tax=Shewanella sedimentimangrovi TaxID=2814293 RepID=A0ABX7R427_9GAMM|nr:hypothetical protein [Shewanella sedimentimangrovi]QSX37583.1 hypothetical protein JYB85_01680 [Shewanella sedimentimangrovi]
MDFRPLLLGLLLWCPALLANTEATMDEINTLLYQYPQQANEQLLQLEQKLKQTPADEQTQLRLSMLKCFTQLELGEFQAAINLAQWGEARAKQLGLEQARPYFMSCLADAYSGFNDLEHAMPLLDSAVFLARHQQQPQALVMALRFRGQEDTENDNFSSAIEDLRLALDAYDDIMKQEQHWAWPPKAYVLAAMGNLLYVSGDLERGLEYNQKGLEDPAAQGKIRQVLLLNSARIAATLKNNSLSASLLKQAKQLLPEIKSAQQLAISYAIIASIEFELGDVSNAENIALVALNTFEQQGSELHAMRTRRLLAEVYLQQGKLQQASEQLEKVENTAYKTNSYYELKVALTMLAQSKARAGEFKSAYALMERAAEATAKANANANTAQLLQYKARLAQQSAASTQAELIEENLQQKYRFNWLYTIMLMLTLILVIVALALFIRSSRPVTTPQQVTNDGAFSGMELLEHAMQHAKRGNYPLSVILLSLVVEDAQTLEQLRSQLELSLRETDSILALHADEWLILLPYTSHKGLERVMTQLNPLLAPTARVAGHASLQQFDSSTSLLKRASCRGLSQSSLA